MTYIPSNTLKYFICLPRCTFFCSYQNMKPAVQIKGFVWSYAFYPTKESKKAPEPGVYCRYTTFISLPSIKNFIKYCTIIPKSTAQYFDIIKDLWVSSKDSWILSAKHITCQQSSSITEYHYPASILVAQHLKKTNIFLTRQKRQP